jgi:hypothetical protein
MADLVARLVTDSQGRIVDAEPEAVRLLNVRSPASRFSREVLSNRSSRPDD